MKTQTEIPSDEPTIVMTRTYDAPRELVWRVTTQAKHVRKWWGGPGFSNPVCEMDVRPGGSWKHVLRFPDGKEMALTFVFLEVEPPTRLVWRHKESSFPGPNPHFTSTLEDIGPRLTQTTLVVRFASIEERDVAVGFGFTGPIEVSNDRLADYLESGEAAA